MCTLIVALRCRDEAPLVLALNRDELLARPTESMHLWQGDDVPIVAGRDRRSEGTWFAIGPHLVAALTNDRSTSPSMAGERTRGELVVNAARATSFEQARAELATIDPAAYGGFHLIVTDTEEMLWATNRGKALEIQDVPAGIHVLGNFGMDEPEDPVVQRLSAALDDVTGAPEQDFDDALTKMLRSHGEGWPCVHYGPYGTCSAAVLHRGGDRDKLRITDGPSCTSEWRDVTELLQQLPRE